jgi:hypothetical protein
MFFLPITTSSTLYSYSLLGEFIFGNLKNY